MCVYHVQAVTKGINAMATTKVAVAPVESMLKYDRTFTGSGTDTDVVCRPNASSLPQFRAKPLKRPTSVRETSKKHPPPCRHLRPSC